MRLIATITAALLLINTANAFDFQPAAQTSEENLQPGPEHSPEEVVRIVVAALGRNDKPYENAGIETAFRFASPANKRNTGPLERFVRLVSNPVYGPMLNHRYAHFEAMKIVGDVAVQVVVLGGGDGKRYGYLFQLSRQGEGPHLNSWMTDSVMPVGVPKGLQEA